jgi:hypothetical protein
MRTINVVNTAIDAALFVVPFWIVLAIIGGLRCFKVGVPDNHWVAASFLWLGSMLSLILDVMLAVIFYNYITSILFYKTEE